MSVAALALAAAWSVVGLPSASAAGAAHAAQSEVVDGAWVAFFRGPEGVWVYVRAPAGEALGARAPTLRVDGAASLNLGALADDYARLGIDWGRRTARDIALPLGAATSASATVAALLTGREIAVEFANAGGDIRTVRLSLAGAAPALRDALRLDASGTLADEAPSAQAESLQAYTVALNRSCIATRPADVGACLSRVTGCGQASIDAADLLACVAARGMELPRAWQARTADAARAASASR